MKYEYDIVLSFAGEDRKYVEKVAFFLNSLNVRVFYDNWETHRLVGENLYDYFADLYQNRATYCAMFISKNYVKKAWPRHERTFAQARALFQKSSYILPIRLDESPCPGIAPTIGYIDGRKLNPSNTAILILKKLGKDIYASDVGEYYLKRLMKWRIFWNGSIHARGHFQYLYLGKAFKKAYKTFSIWSTDERLLNIKHFEAYDSKGLLKTSIRARTKTSVEYKILFRKPLQFGDSIEYRISYMCVGYYGDLTERCQDDFVAGVAILDWQYEFLFPKNSHLDVFRMYRIFGKDRLTHAFISDIQKGAPCVECKFAKPEIGTKLEIMFKLGQGKY